MAPNPPSTQDRTNVESAPGLQASLKDASAVFSSGLVLVVIGLLGMLFLYNRVFPILFYIGLALLVISAVQILPRILDRNQIVDQWDYLISGAEGKGESIVQATEQLLAQTRAPDVKVERQAISPGLVRGLLGGQRCFLVVANTKNLNLEPYQLCINTQDYGVNLQVSWYLIQKPFAWQKVMMIAVCIPVLGLFVLPFYLVIRLALSRQGGPLGLDIFDEQDLRAYVTNAHHCMLGAVEELLHSLNQDASRIQRQSKGFLGIS